MEVRYSHVSADGNCTDLCEERRRRPVCSYTVCGFLRFISEVLYFAVYVSVAVFLHAPMSVCLVKILTDLDSDLN